MTEGFGNEQNPSGIWQKLWVDLITNFNVIMASPIINSPNKYEKAWQTQELLHGQIPPECQQDTQETFKKTKEVMQRKVTGYDAVDRARYKQQTNYLEREALLNLNTETIISLFAHKWINKSFGAKPRFERKGHLAVPEA